MEIMELDIKPASDYPTPDLVELLNLSFESYLVPIHVDSVHFLSMLRRDSIDLAASRILCIDNQFAGIALIARRGWTSRLAAMGITKEFRGKRAGTWFMDKLIHESRERNDREMVLEVIEQNESAVRLYRNCGFEAVRRLIGLVYREEKPVQKSDLQELDLREMGGLVVRYGLSDLPWQISGETIALMNHPNRAYTMNKAHVAISNPELEHVFFWSLLVEPSARGKGLALDMIRSVMAQYTGKTWHVPAIWPEKFGALFERAGFQREELSQWQMRMSLQ